MNYPTTVTDSGGTTLATYGYDNLARRASVQYNGTTGAKMLWSWSAEDDLLTLSNDFAGTANDVAYTHTFTPAHQWAGATTSNAAFRFLPPTVSTLTYGAANNVNQVSTLNGTALNWDANGNYVGTAAGFYVYDAENRLMSASTTQAFAYDPSGRRTMTNFSGTVTSFVHDGDTEIAEYDGSGNLVRRFVPGAAIDEYIAMVTAAGAKTFFHTDKMGSVTAMSDMGGNLVEGPYLYDAYGRCYNAGGSTCATGEPFRYTGQRLDLAANVYYYRARYYSAILGTFFQTDPVGYKDNLDLYAYVGDDPTDRTDPSGEVVISLGGSADAYYIFGGGGSAGVYVDTDTGEFGVYATGEAGTGIGATAGGTLGVSKSMKTFRGQSSQVRVGAGPVAGQVNMPHLDKPITGGSVSLGVGTPFDFTMSKSYTVTGCLFFCGDKAQQEPPQKKSHPNKHYKPSTPVASINPEVLTRPAGRQGATGEMWATEIGRAQSTSHTCTGSHISTSNPCTSF